MDIYHHHHHHGLFIINFIVSVKLSSTLIDSMLVNINFDINLPVDIFHHIDSSFEKGAGNKIQKLAKSNVHVHYCPYLCNLIPIDCQ